MSIFRGGEKGRQQRQQNIDRYIIDRAQIPEALDQIGEKSGDGAGDNPAYSGGKNGTDAVKIQGQTQLRDKQGGKYIEQNTDSTQLHNAQIFTFLRVHIRQAHEEESPFKRDAKSNLYPNVTQISTAVNDT